MDQLHVCRSYISRDDSRNIAPATIGEIELDPPRDRGALMSRAKMLSPSDFAPASELAPSSLLIAGLFCPERRWRSPPHRHTDGSLSEEPRHRVPRRVTASTD
jgi:5-deoxy-D-glucuronate isomerase